jgi:hypothetical protein
VIAAPYARLGATHPANGGEAGMADQVINGTLDLEIPGASTPIKSLTINVQSFGTFPNAVASHYIVARDIGAAPPNGFTHFIVRGDGNVGIGTATPSARLEVKGSAIVDAPASSSPLKVLTVNAESFTTIPNLLASFFIVASDVGAAPPAGEVKFSVRGDGQIFTRGGVRYPDGSVQTTASPPPHVVLGEAPAGGFVFVLRATGNVGIAGLSQNTGGGGVVLVNGSGGQSRAILSENMGNAGFLALLGPAGQQAVQLSTVAGSPDNGAIAVTDAAGAAAGVFRAQLAVDNGKGTLSADEKNFRVPNPAQADTDIVYACIEGPEAAAYVRGTAKLANGACTVTLPDHFAAVIAAKGMTVHVTPLSADSLGLAVVKKSPKSFAVRELQHGTGSYAFDWEAKAIRKGYEDYKVIRPQHERSLGEYQPAIAT